MKKHGFTLAEVLITLAIVGVIAILVIPAVMKDIGTKSRMTMLRSTVTSFGDAVSSELLHSRAKSITTTQIAKNPKQFLTDNMDVTGKYTEVFATDYRTLNGGSIAVTLPENGSSDQEAAVTLKNGVAIGIVNDAATGISEVVVDVNGADEPNIVGADYFVFELAWRDDTNNGVRFGDIGGAASVGSDKSDLKSKCIAGNAKACYKLAELSGFDPDYIGN